MPFLSLQEFVSNIKENSKNIKRNLRRFGLALAASSMIVSCQDCNPFPPSDLPPEATLTVDKTSVNKGESVNVKVNGTAKSFKNLRDVNAKSDKFIVSYHLDADYDGNGSIDETIDQETPIDVNRQLDYVGKAKFSAMVVDNKGLTSDVKSLEVIVNDIPIVNHAPVVSLSANPNSLKVGESSQLSLNATDEDGDTIVKYKLYADFNLDDTVSSDEVKEQNNVISFSKQFNTPGIIKVYGEAYDDKGNVGRNSVDVNVGNIPVNKLPQVDLSAVDKSLIDGKEKTITLPEPTDEDTPGIIPYTKVDVIEGNAYLDSISLNPTTKELSIKAKAVSQNQNYKLRLSFGTDETNKNTADLEGIIYNLCNIKGQIESNGEAEGITKAGDVIAYDVIKEVYGSITKGENVIPETSTPDGKFNVQANKVINKILLRARFNDPGNLDGDNKSYVRSLILDASKDYDNIVMVCEPSPNPSTFPVTKQDFYQFVLNTYPDYSLEKWDLSTIEGIEVLYKHPNPDIGEFNSLAREALRERIYASDGVKALFNHKLDSAIDNGIVKVQIDDESTTEFHYNYIGGFIGSHPNWIVVVPVYDLRDINNVPCAGLTGVQYLNNNADGHILNGAVIELNTSQIYGDYEWLKRVGMHELNHAITSPCGEGTTLMRQYSVMGNMKSAGPADIKKANLIYSGRYKAGEEYKRILGTDF